MASTLKDIIDGVDCEKAVKKAMRINSKFLDTNKKRKDFSRNVLSALIMRRRLYFLLEGREFSTGQLASCSIELAKKLIIMNFIDEVKFDFHELDELESMGFFSVAEAAAPSFIRVDTFRKVVKRKRQLEQLSQIDFANNPLNIRAATKLLGINFSLPNWLAERFVNQYGQLDSMLLAAACNQPGPITIRRNKLVG